MIGSASDFFDGDLNLDNLAVLASRCTGSARAFVNLLQGQQLFPMGVHGIEATSPRPLPMALRSMPCSLVVGSGQPVVVEDAARDPRIQSSPELRAVLMGAYLGVPVHLPSGELIGTVCAIDDGPRDWSALDEDALVRLAQSVRAELVARGLEPAMASALDDKAAAERDLRTVIGALPLSAYIFDAVTLDVLDVNPAACRTYGYSRDEFLALSIRDLRRPADQAGLDAALKKVDLSPADACGCRFRHVTRGGTDLLVEVDTAPVDFRGRKARLVVARDVTAAARDQEELQLLRSAIARLNDIVLITEAEPLDAPGPRVVFVNEAFERRTGFRSDEVIGQTPRILQGPKTDRDVLDRIRSSLSKWEPVRAELINYTKSGEEFWLELDIVPVGDAGGLYTHWIAIERDITERKHMEQEREQSQRLQAIGQFSGGIAHDFANITAIIGTSAELLRARLPEVASDPDLEQIIASTDRARSLVGQILAFSRRQVLDLKELVLQEVVLRTEAMLRRLLDGNVALRTNLPATAVRVLADETQIVQVLLNLAGNARDAMPVGGVLEVTVEEVTRDGGAYGRLRVADTGCGIPPEHLAIIFEPFFTTKALGHGTGLGLATVYGIVQQLGGEMRVESVLGSGTVFEIDLPIVRSTDGHQADRPVAEAVNQRSREEILVGLRVLLVEDEDALRRTTQRLLQRYGAIVDVASNGLEALQLFRQQSPPPDLVLTDLMMPVLGGGELAQTLAGINADVPVLMMSGYDAGGASAATGGLRTIGHLQKPFDVDSLLTAVADAMRAQR